MTDHLRTANVATLRGLWRRIGDNRLENLSLLTDLYQLTMLAGYHHAGKLSQKTCFDLYFRRCPFQGSYAVAAGLEQALGYLEELSFETEDLDYLSSLGLFSDPFLSWLGELRFEGSVWAVSEGELVFPGEPLVRVEAALPVAQLVESALLNMINFQTLVATKAARVATAAGEDLVLEFGLRRAQGIDGSLSASRAAYLGGCHATSNTLAGKKFGIPVKGTHAHSWIMSFPTELAAFQAYADLYPDDCTLLVDTYDTLGSGVPNAIRVGRDLKEKGHTLGGIRLDSGDLAQLSIESRRLLDEAGLTETRIVASNDLDEHAMAAIKAQGGRIDIWGVGTKLATCKDDPALGGVYKLVAAADQDGVMEPKIKLSSSPGKVTIPGIKQVYRFYDADDRMVGDILQLAEEREPSPHQSYPSRSPMDSEVSCELRGARVRPLLQSVWEGKSRTAQSETLEEKRGRTLRSLESLPSPHKKLRDAEPYWVGLGERLFSLRASLIRRESQEEPSPSA